MVFQVTKSGFDSNVARIARQQAQCRMRRKINLSCLFLSIFYNMRHHV